MSSGLVLMVIGVAFLVVGWFAPTEPRWAGNLAFTVCFLLAVFSIAEGAERAWGSGV